MSTQSRHIVRVALLACGRTLIVLGGLIFLLGDRLLRGVFDYRFMYAEVVGLLGGAIIMAIGGLLQYAAKSPD